MARNLTTPVYSGSLKLDKITDNRKLDVKKEYEILYEKLKDFIEKYQNFQIFILLFMMIILFSMRII